MESVEDPRVLHNLCHYSQQLHMSSVEKLGNYQFYSELVLFIMDGLSRLYDHLKFQYLLLFSSICSMIFSKTRTFGLLNTLSALSLLNCFNAKPGNTHPNNVSDNYVFVICRMYIELCARLRKRNIIYV